MVNKNACIREINAQTSQVSHISCETHAFPPAPKLSDAFFSAQLRIIFMPEIDNKLQLITTRQQVQT